MLEVEGQGAQKQSKQGAKLEKIYRQRKRAGPKGIQSLIEELSAANQSTQLALEETFEENRESELRVKTFRRFKV